MQTNYVANYIYIYEKRVNFRTNNKYKENKFGISFCREKKKKQALPPERGDGGGGRKRGEQSLETVVCEGRGLCTMHLAAAILTESDKSGENGWLWPVNIEMVGEGGLPPAVVYRRYRKSRRNQRQLFRAPLPCPLDRCCTGDEKVKISSES